MDCVLTLGLLPLSHFLFIQQFDLDSIWTFIFGVPASSGTVVSSVHSICTEAAFLLLGMLRSMLNSVSPFSIPFFWFRKVLVTYLGHPGTVFFRH